MGDLVPIAAGAQSFSVEGGELVARPNSQNEGLASLQSREEFLLRATKGEVVVTAWNGDDIPTGDKARYALLAHKAIADDPALLNWIDAETAFSERSVVTLVKDRDVLELGLYAVRGITNGEPTLFVKGLVSTKTLRGVVPQMIASTFLGDAHWRGRFAAGKAIARILRNDEVNIASSLNFARLGFFAAKSYCEEIDLQNIHRALPGSVEPDGVSVRALLMRAKAKDIEPRSRELLGGWAVELGKAGNVLSVDNIKED